MDSTSPKANDRDAQEKSSQAAGGGYGSDPNSEGNQVEVSPNSGMTSGGGTGGGMGGGTAGGNQDTTVGTPGPRE